MLLLFLTLSYPSQTPPFLIDVEPGELTEEDLNDEDKVSQEKLSLLGKVKYLFRSFAQIPVYWLVHLLSDQCIRLSNTWQFFSSAVGKYGVKKTSQNLYCSAINRMYLSGLLSGWGLVLGNWANILYFLYLSSSVIEKSQKIKDMLSNKHLQRVLKTIDEKDSEQELEAAMKLPLFVEFANECLKLVDDWKLWLMS